MRLTAGKIENVIVVAGAFVGTLFEPREIVVTFSEDGRPFSYAERRAVQGVAEGAARDVRALLPALPKRLTLLVRTGEKVIPETGEDGTTEGAAGIVWTVDPARDVRAIIGTELRPTLFHEMHHLVRYGSVTDTTLVDNAITEGMATAFERSFANVDPPWGKRTPEIEAWTRELLRQPDDAPPNEWLLDHPDGRRWIGMRVGTYLVDRAAEASGKSSAELVFAAPGEVLRLAGFPRTPAR